MNLKSILGKVKARKAKRVFIQVPEGLKTSVLELADFLGKNGLKFLSHQRHVLEPVT